MRTATNKKKNKKWCIAKHGRKWCFTKELQLVTTVNKMSRDSERCDSGGYRSDACGDLLTWCCCGWMCANACSDSRPCSTAVNGLVIIPRLTGARIGELDVVCRLLRSSAPPLLVAIDASIKHAGYMTDTVTVAVGGSGACASMHRGELRCIGTRDDYK